MPVYIEEFINEGVKLLLHGKGYEFIELYHKTVEDIYNYRIPVLKIASKSKVKMTRNNYVDVYCKQKNKAGRHKSRQAHMELIEMHDLNVDLGDVIYYVNTGTAKSHSDIKKVTDKETENIEILFNCKLLPKEEIENNPEYTTDEYNVAKYLDNFNKRIKPLLVCFDTEIRSDIIRNVYKDKKTKVVKLDEKNLYTKKQCELIAGKPFEPSDQDDYHEDLMKMEDREIRFWDSVNKVPNFMEEDEWVNLRDDWRERERVRRLKAIDEEFKLLNDIFKRLEVSDYNKLRSSNKLPKELNFVSLVKDDIGNFYFNSNEWDVELADFKDIFKYEDLAIKRNRYYETLEDVNDNDKYDMWLEKNNNSESEIEEFDNDIKLLKDDGWIEVLDGYWVEEYIVKEGKVDYYKACTTKERAVASIKGRIKDLETIKNQNPDDLIIKP